MHKACLWSCIWNKTSISFVLLIPPLLCLSTADTWLFAITPSHALLTLLHRLDGGTSWCIRCALVSGVVKGALNECLDTVNIVQHISAQIKHKYSTTKPGWLVSRCCYVFRGFTVNYLSSWYPLSLRCDIQGGMCVFASAACPSAPECHTIMRMDMTVTGPSANRAAGLPPFLLVTCGADVLLPTHTNMHPAYAQSCFIWDSGVQ